MNSKLLNKFFLIVLTASLLWACTLQTTPTEFSTTTGTEEILEATAPINATPEEGLTSLVGRVVYPDGKPMANQQMRLAEVYRSETDPEQGAYILDTAFSPGTYSDENGYFVFANIKAMEYIIVLGNPEAVYEITLDENGKAKVWQTEANKVVDIGELVSDFDPTNY